MRDKTVRQAAEAHIGFDKLGHLRLFLRCDSDRSVSISSGEHHCVGQLTSPDDLERLLVASLEKLKAVVMA